MKNRDAMTALDAVLEAYYRTQTTAVDALNQIAAIYGELKNTPEEER